MNTINDKVIDALRNKANEIEELTAFNRRGYFTLEFDPDEHNVEDWEVIKIRVSDHSHNPDNNSLEEQMLSFVTEPRPEDPTADKFDGCNIHLGDEPEEHALEIVAEEINYMCDFIGVDFRINLAMGKKFA